MNGIPIIKIEFESMRHSLRVAMTNHMVKLDSDVQAAIDRYCTSENLQAIIDASVRESVNVAVKEEVQSLFRYSGPGREAIRQEIMKRADELWGPL